MTDSNLNPVKAPTTRPSSLLSALMLAFSLAWSACGSADTAATLTFTAIPDDNATALSARFQPLADQLEAELGIPVRYVPTSDYRASVEAFATGDVQLAWFGGLTGVQARASVDGARAIAQGKIDPTFKSYFIAHANTGLERSDSFPTALADRSFTFGSASSTSGRLMPESFLRTATGKSPEAFFGTPNHYSGSHDKTAELVAAGTFEAGVLNYKTYERLVAGGTIDPALVRIVWETPEYADYNWTAHPMLDERFGAGFIDRVQAALVAIDDAALLAAVDRAEGLIPASNQDFEAIHAVAAELGFLD